MSVGGDNGIGVLGKMCGYGFGKGCKGVGVLD